jgi:hypothetical protein
MSRCAVFAALLALPVAAWSHGHPGSVDPGNPDAWKYRLCGEMVTVAIQALYDRDRGRPMKRYDDDGTPGPRIANGIIGKVYAEPAIASPKRAETFGRGYCMEQLQE